MTQWSLVAIVLAAGMAVQAKPADEQRLTVYVQNPAKVPCNVRFKAQELASGMFASLGVKIEWRNADALVPLPESALVLLLSKSRTQDQPGALGYSLPFEGHHAFVFWDRVEYSTVPTQLLAHVMAHEITHLLEGLNRHSETGVMKAHWTEYDLRVIKTHPLFFTSEDVDLIHRGVAARSVSLAASSFFTTIEVTHK